VALIATASALTALPAAYVPTSSGFIYVAMAGNVRAVAVA
jgi:hypothetical protein